MAEAEHEQNCIRCEAIECLNLFKTAKSPTDAGNELYVYSLLVEKIRNDEDLAAYVCTNGRFLNASCFLAVPIYIDAKDGFLNDILIQVTRDFKASIFLAFSGHYRQAMQVLRCAFENLISGLYFQSDYADLKRKKAAPEEFSTLNKKFNEWKRQGRGEIYKSIEILRRIGFFSEEKEREMRKLYELLSRFIHTPREFIPQVEHGKENKLYVCPALTCFSKKQLAEWSDGFQSVFALLLKAIAEYHPEAFHSESGKLAVTKCIKPELKAHSAKITNSKEIEAILSQIHNPA